MNNHSTTPVNLLLVEDNVFFSHVLFEMLSREGFNVDFALTRQQTLHALMNSRYDLILCDYNLPDVKGSNLLHLLHNLVPKTPLVVLSGEEPCDISELLDTQVVNGFIEKPCARDPLLNVLNNALGESIRLPTTES